MHPTTLPAFCLLCLIPLPLPAQDQATGAKVGLQIQAAKDQTFYFKTSTKMEQAIDMGGQPMDMGNEVHQTVSLKVLDLDAQGNLQVEWLVHSIRGSMTLPMLGDVTFDSTKKPEETDGGDVPGMPNVAGIGKAMTMLAGKKLGAKISRSGDVSGVTGVEELLAAARKEAGGMGAQMLGGTLNEGAIRHQIQNLVGTLPTDAQAVGGTWQRSNLRQGSRGMTMRVEMASKLDQVTAEQVQISSTGTLAIAQPAAAAAKPEAEEDEATAMQREMMSKMKLENGKVKGTETVSRKDGFVLKASGDMAMDLTVPSPMGGGEMKIAQKITTTVERTTAAQMLPAAKPEAGKKEPAKQDAGK